MGETPRGLDYLKPAELFMVELNDFLWLIELALLWDTLATELWGAFILSLSMEVMFELINVS